MLDWHRFDRIYICPGRTDMRKAISGLLILIEQEMRLDVFQRSAFLFCGMSKRNLKIPFWDRNGFGAAWLVALAVTISNFSEKTNARFRCAGEKSPRIRARMAPREANSTNLRKNSRRLGQLNSQKNCANDLPGSLVLSAAEKTRQR